MTAHTPLGPRFFAGTAGDDLVAAVIEVDSANRRIRNRLAKQLGFSVTELTALFLIGDVDAATPKVLVGELGMTTGAVTAILDRLERAGYVERIPHPSDRRSLLLTLSFRGEDVMAEVLDLYAGAIHVAASSYPGDMSQMATQLIHIAQSIDQADDDTIGTVTTTPAA